MTNKELQEKIAHLETELAEAKKTAEAMKKEADGGGVFKPKNGEKYWQIENDGGVYSEWWEDYYFDEDLYSIGNCFPTEQAAKDTVYVLKLIQKARESQDGFVPDWEDMTQYKYSLYADESGIWTASYSAFDVVPLFGYWGDRLTCERFLKDNYEEFVWFFTEYQR